MPDSNAPQIDEDGYVALKLAHPLSAEQVNNLRPKEPVEKDHGVGDTIYVTRDYGLAVIESGFAQVDPEDRKAVRHAIGLNGRMQPLTREELDELNGDGSLASPAPLEGMQSAATTPPAPTSTEAEKQKPAAPAAPAQATAPAAAPPAKAADAPAKQ